MEQETRHEGVVVFFNDKRGWGFIDCPDFDKDVFCHWKHIVAEGFKTLQKDDKVSFTIGQNDNGRIACDIKVLEKAIQQ